MSESKLHALLRQKEGESWMVFFLRKRRAIDPHHPRDRIKVSFHKTVA